MDLPAPLSCFSLVHRRFGGGGGETWVRGYELLQSRIRSSDIQLSEQCNLRMRKSMSSKKPVRPWPDRPEWVLRLWYVSGHRPHQF